MSAIKESVVVVVVACCSGSNGQSTVVLKVLVMMAVVGSATMISSMMKAVPKAVALFANTRVAKLGKNCLRAVVITAGVTFLVVAMAASMAIP